jgi:CHAT domain-containing protein
MLGLGVAPPGLLDEAQARKVQARDRAQARADEALNRHDFVACLKESAEVLAINLAIHGPHHLRTARAAENAALCCRFAGLYKDQIAYLRVALEARRALHGEDWWESVNVRLAKDDAARMLALTEKKRNDLKQAFALMGRMTILYRSGRAIEAARVAQRIVDLRKGVLGEKHPDTLDAVSSLATILNEAGDNRTAALLARQAAEGMRQALGEWHPRHAVTLNTLALVYSSMGDGRLACTLLKRALAIRKHTLGTDSSGYATGLNNLAHAHGQLGEHGQARRLASEALAVTGRALGVSHPRYALALSNLAIHTVNAGDPAAALPLAQRGLVITQLLLGDNHPQNASSLHALSLVHHRLGQTEKALNLSLQAAHRVASVQGAHHPDYAICLNELGILYRSLGRPSGAVALSGQSLRITRALLDATYAVQSERQQLAAIRSIRPRLDLLLSLPTAPDEMAYSEVLAWKGGVFTLARKRRAAAAAAAGGGKASRLAQELEDACREIATLSLATDPGPGKASRRLDELAARKEQLEAELSALSEDYAREAPPTPQQLASNLPEDAALIDFLFFDTPDGRKLTAFISRKGRPAARVSLGSARPITQAALAWRSAILARKDGLREGAAVKRLLWLPLENHLEGASVALVSPDAELCSLPLAALPGKKAGTYLIEDLTLAVLPVPRLLPQTLATARRTPRLPPSLLAVGDIDFDAGGSGPSEAERRIPPTAAGGWDKLEATATEIADITRTFRKLHRAGAVTELSDAEATRVAVRKALPASRYAHLATHAYFAPAETRSALHGEGWSPLLLSGIVLSGANRNQPEGVLTALEVSELGLEGVELAVLSACETGLGQVAAGEGVLGLQRAFQVAGCRAVLASLWKVDDRATQILMGDFYRGLWDRDRPLPRAAALQRAQLSLLREGAKRGLKPATPAIGGEARRLPPYFWAGFVLSGDWR